MFATPPAHRCQHVVDSGSQPKDLTIKKFQAALLILAALSSTAIAQTQEGTLVYGSGASPVPVMGGVMILVLALLIFAVNFRAIKRRISSPLLIVLGASLIAGLFSVTGGQLISEAYAPPFTSLSNPNGGTVPVYGDNFNSFRNTSGAATKILSITLPSKCANFPEFTTNNCSENFLLATNESCDIDCRQGQIIINKTVVGVDKGFNFAATYDQDGFILSNGQSNQSQALQTGSYTITETIPADYALTDISCPGEYSSTIADDGVITVFDLLPGQYSSTENVPSPWALTDISCNDDNSTGSLSNATANFVVEAGSKRVFQQNRPKGVT